MSPQVGGQFGSIRFPLEHEIHGLRIAAGDGHFLGLLAVGLAPGGDRVISRGQVRQLEFAVAGGDRVVRIFHDCECALHPRVDIALRGDEFRSRIFIFAGGRVDITSPHIPELAAREKKSGANNK